MSRGIRRRAIVSCLQSWIKIWAATNLKTIARFKQLWLMADKKGQGLTAKRNGFARQVKFLIGTLRKISVTAVELS
jgi:hypothetical protein